MIHSRSLGDPSNDPGYIAHPVSRLLYYHERMNHVQYRGTGFLPSHVLPEDETLILDEVSRESFSFNTTLSINDGTSTINEVGLMGRHDRNKSNGLPEETIIRHLKTRTYQAPCTKTQDSIVCVVCQIEYGIGERLGTLDCGHEFHAICINRWLLEMNACPLCRRTAIQQEAS